MAAGTAQFHTTHHFIAEFSPGVPAWEFPLYSIPSLLSFRQQFSNPSLPRRITWGFVKTQILGCISRVSDSVSLGGAQEFAFLNSPVTLMLLVQGLHFYYLCFRLAFPKCRNMFIQVFHTVSNDFSPKSIKIGIYQNSV